MYKWKYVWMKVCMNESMYVWKNDSMYERMTVRIKEWQYVWKNESMYVCMYVCMHVCTYWYIVAYD